jgi:serine/threonine-protein kinase RsbW
MNEKLKFNAIEKMSVPMELNQELKVIERVEKLARELGFDRDSIDEIKLAVIEAVINAIEHGSNAERIVYITFGLSRQPLRMTVTISDSGAGFNPDSVREPDIREKINKHERKRGWGLKIMRSLMDEVIINSSPSGTQVTLIKSG